MSIMQKRLKVTMNSKKNEPILNFNNSLHKNTTNLMKKKHWNLYADGSLYRMDFWLNFSKPILNKKYNRDIYRRTRYTLIAVLFHFIAIFIYHWYSAETNYSLLMNLTACFCLIISLILRFMNFSPYYIRICLMYPLMMFQNISANYEIPLFMFLLIVNLPIDSCLSFSWKKFILFGIIHVYFEKYIFNSEFIAYSDQSFFMLFITMTF